MKGHIAPPTEQLAAQLYNAYRSAHPEISDCETNIWENLFAYNPTEYNAWVAVATAALNSNIKTP
jgi:hypothetical protein